MQRKPFVGILGPEVGLDTVQLTERERATLRAAARILETLRDLRDDDDDLGVDIALAQYTLSDLAADGRVAA